MGKRKQAKPLLLQAQSPIIEDIVPHWLAVKQTASLPSCLIVYGSRKKNAPGLNKLASCQPRIDGQFFGAKTDGL